MSNYYLVTSKLDFLQPYYYGSALSPHVGQSRSCLVVTVLPQTQLAIQTGGVLYKLGMLHSITKLLAEHQDALKLATSVQLGQERKSQ